MLLPNEFLILIPQYIDLRTLLNMSKVNKKWHKLFTPQDLILYFQDWYEDASGYGKAMCNVYIGVPTKTKIPETFYPDYSVDWNECFYQGVSKVPFQKFKTCLIKCGFSHDSDYIVKLSVINNNTIKNEIYISDDNDPWTYIDININIGIMLPYNDNIDKLILNKEEIEEQFIESYIGKISTERFDDHTQYIYFDNTGKLISFNRQAYDGDNRFKYYEFIKSSQYEHFYVQLKALWPKNFLIDPYHYQLIVKIINRCYQKLKN